MGQLFAKPPRQEPSTHSSSGAGAVKRTLSEKDMAVVKLKRTRDKLTKFQKKTDIDAEKLQAQAKTLIQQGRKDRALLALKVRKLRLQEVAKVDLKLLDLVKMIDEIEWESQNVEVLRALEAGTAALDQLHREMPIDEVERILEESAESIETQSQISDMLSGGVFTELDDSELEAELEALGGYDEDDVVVGSPKAIPDEGNSETKKSEVVTETATDELRLPEIPTNLVLPLVPTHDPVIAADDKANTRHEEERNLVGA